MYQKKRDIISLLDLLEKQPSLTRCVEIDSETNVSEMRVEVAPGIGISIIGELNEEGKFEREFYFPYLDNIIESTTAECSIQRHAERETFAGMADEMKIGISLIFYVQNLLEFREKQQRKSGPHRIKSVSLSGLSVSGKVLLPVKKTPKQIEMARVAMTNRNNLIEAARNGDESAMETLTIEDIDLYSRISTSDGISHSLMTRFPDSNLPPAICTDPVHIPWSTTVSLSVLSTAPSSTTTWLVTVESSLWRIRASGE